jgi:hypothetical protein
MKIGRPYAGRKMAKKYTPKETCRDGYMKIYNKIVHNNGIEIQRRIYGEFFGNLFKKSYSN